MSRTKQQPGAWSPVMTARPQGVTAAERLTEQEARLRELQTKMHGWNEYVREMKVLPDVAPALSTGRPELLALMAPRPLTAAECEVLFDMLRVLIDTNAALRTHSELLAQVAEQQHELASGMVKKLGQLVDYAHFRNPGDDEGDEE